MRQIVLEKSCGETQNRWNRSGHHHHQTTPPEVGQIHQSSNQCQLKNSKANVEVWFCRFQQCCLWLSVNQGLTRKVCTRTWLRVAVRGARLRDGLGDSDATRRSAQLCAAPRLSILTLLIHRRQGQFGLRPSCEGHIKATLRMKK